MSGAVAWLSDSESIVQTLPVQLRPAPLFHSGGWQWVPLPSSLVLSAAANSDAGAVAATGASYNGVSGDCPERQGVKHE